MKILFADQYGELGGAQQCLLELIPAVLERGWKPFAAVPPAGELGTRLRRAGVTVREVDVLRMGPAMRAWNREHGFQLAYINGPRVLPAACLLPRSIPLVFHAHSYLPAGPARTLVRTCLRLRNATVIAVSRFVASYVGDAYVIANGAPKMPPSRPPKTTTIGIVGRIAPEKGHLEFVEAARLLPRHWRFVICGAARIADPAYEKRVREAAAGLPVEFLGWREDIGEVLQHLSLLAVPSASNEGLGRVILEAFSARVPVVAFASGGIPELIQDGVSGYLVLQRTAEALAGKIQEVLADHTRMCEVAETAHALYLSQYTLSHYQDRVTNVIARAAIHVNNAAANNTGG